MNSYVKRMAILAVMAFLIGGCRTRGTEGITPTNMVFEMTVVDNIFFTTDGGVLISGIAGSKYSIIKTNDNFDIEWTQNQYEWGKLFHGNSWGAEFYTVNIIKNFETAAGNFVCFGQVEDGGDDVDENVIMVMLDAKGNQLEKIEFPNSLVKNVLQTSDGGFLLLGVDDVTKLDSHFQQVWTKTTIGRDFQFQQQIILTANDGFAITGRYGSNTNETFLKTFDATGSEMLVLTLFRCLMKDS